MIPSYKGVSLWRHQTRQSQHRLAPFLPPLQPSASELYSKNLLALLELMLDDNGAFTPDFDDEVLAGACVTREEVSA